MALNMVTLLVSEYHCVASLIVVDAWLRVNKMMLGELLRGSEEKQY